MRLLGLDVGDKRIGVALSDPLEILASMLTVIERTEDGKELADIVALVRERGVERIIVGLPRLMDGEIGTQARKTQDFAENLSRYTGVPVEMCDERLSTNVAEQLLREAGRAGREIREMKDAAAAAVILQWYLDQKAGRRQLLEEDSQ